MKTPQTPLENIDLELLLEQIRLRGILVGTMELQRLQTIFKHSPQLSRAELSDLLCTVLAKDTNQQLTIERVFQRWVPFDAELTPNENPNDPQQTTHINKTKDDKLNDKSTSENKKKSKSKKHQKVAFIGLATLFSIVLLALLITFLNTEAQPKLGSNGETKRLTFLSTKEQPKQGNNGDTKHLTPNSSYVKTKKEKPIDSKLKLQETITIWTPQLHIHSINLWDKVLPPLALLLGSGLGFFWLLQQALKSIRTRDPDNVYLHNQRIRSYLPNLQHSLPYHLLNPKERREMGWGISHYISDQPLQQLDMQRSVAESAKQGLPSVHFKQAKHERQVWLWLDRHSQNPDLLRLANEITQTLSGMNIEVQKTYFYGLPNRVMNSQGEVIWSLRHQQPENQPLLLVLMDINSLHNLSASQSLLETQTFRQLSHWSHVTVVDCSHKAGQLHPLVKAHKLGCLLPQEVPHWLAKQGEGSLKKINPACSLDELYRWVCACAMPQRPVSEAEIRALHEQLQLNCAWQYHNLSLYTQSGTHSSAQGFNFNWQRHLLLNDLAKSSDLDGAVQFWISRNQEIDQILLDESNAKEAWSGSRPQKQLHIDIALLQLWQAQTIDKASNTLFDLYQQDALKTDIKQKIQQLSCKGLGQSFGENEPKSCFINLPHSWHNLKLNTRRQLLGIGFAGNFKYLDAKWDKLTATVLGLLAGLILVGLFWTGYKLMPIPAKVITQTNSKEPEDKIQKIINPNSLQAKVLVGTTKSLFVQKPIQPNQVAQVYWTPSLRYAQENLDKFNQLWRLGNKAKPKKRHNWFDFSAAIIKASPKDSMVQQLAALLLDTGNVDQVLISSNSNTLQLPKQWEKMPGKQVVDIDFYNVASLFMKLQQNNGIFDFLDKNFIGGGSNINLAKEVKKDVAKTSKSSNLSTEKSNINSIKEDKKEVVKTRKSSNSPTEKSNINSPNEEKKNIVKISKSSNLSSEKSFVKIDSKSKKEVVNKSKSSGKRNIKLANNLNLVPLPRGKFLLDNDQKNYDLWMSQTEITFDQYDAYVKANDIDKPYDAEFGRKSRPVINVSWEDAKGYIKWLNRTNKVKLKKIRCRLPRVSEWKYAVGGTTPGRGNANCDGCGSQWDNKQTAPVASFKVNKFGLNDMVGNVWEWVEDCYHDYGVTRDSAECDSRVLLGGSWFDKPAILSSTPDPEISSFNIGFRVACSLPFIKK